MSTILRKLTLGWAILGWWVLSAHAITGGVDTNSFPNANNDLGLETCGCCVGMPAWSVSEPYLNLWVKDQPLGYQPGKGPAVVFKLGYKLREENAGLLTDEFGVGPRWNCSWLSYVKTGTNGYEVHLPEGGRLNHASLGTVEFYTYTRLETNTGGGYQLIFPDGRTNTYAMSASVNSETRYYLTEQGDRVGQKLTFEYDETFSGARLLRVMDADGRTNRLFYANNDNLITSVIDGFNRTNQLAYDNQGRLTNITDVAGISSSFQYDTNHWMTSLTTPYGVTQFKPTVDTTNLLYGMQVTDAGGGNHLWLYRGANTTSYYWGPRQFEHLTHTNDLANLGMMELLRARQQQWYDVTGNTRLMLEQDFSPDGSNTGQQTSYEYSGQSLPSRISRTLPDASTWYVQTDRNAWGTVTNEISTYSQADGSVGTRTNRFVYSDDGVDLLETYDVDGNRTSGIGYENHLPVSVTNVLGEVTRYSYNPAGQVTGMSSPYGLLTTNLYYTSGEYTGWLEQSLTMAEGLPTRTNHFTYLHGQVHTHTDERGNTVTQYWDNLGRLTGTSDSLGSTTNIYNRLDLVRTVDRLGFTNGFVFDAMRRLTDRFDALGRNTHYEHCLCGLLESITDATGTNTTSFTHDEAGRRIITTGPDNYSVTNTLNLLGQVVAITDSAGTSATNYYNHQGLVYAVSNAVGRVNYREFDLHDRVILSVDANNVTVTNAFDIAGRLTISGTPANGAFTRYGYTFNVPGVTSLTNALTNVTLIHLDAYGRKTAEISGGMVGGTFVALTTNGFTYEVGGALKTLTDGNGQVTTWNLDEFGRVTNKVDATGSPVWAYSFDANHRLISRWTPAKGTTGYGFDEVGNLTNVDYSAGASAMTSVQLRYDLLNRLTNLVDGVGTTAFAYNNAGQMLSEDGPWTDDTVNYSYTQRLRTGLSVGSWSQGYGYDEIKRLTNVTSSAGSFGYRYLPEQMTKVNQLSLPGGGVITNQFDDLARLTSTVYVTPDGAVLNGHGYELNNGNQRTRQTRMSNLATNTVDYGFDPLGQLLSAVGKEADGTLRKQEQFGYAFDAAGNLKTRTNNALVQSFTVNTLNELTSQNNTGTLTVSGNTTSKATNVMVNTETASLYGDWTFAKDGFTLIDGTNTFTAIATDAYGRADTNTVTVNLPATNSFVHDANGNLTFDGQKAFDYDNENQLISVIKTNAWKTEFKYDGMMRCRIIKEYTWTGSWTLSKETHLIYDGMRVIQERDGNNNPQVSYTRGKDLSGSLEGAGGIGGLLARTDFTQTNALLQTAFYHSDGNGNVTALVSTSGLILASYLFDPFGRTLAQSGPLAEVNAYRFSSKLYFTKAGLYYYGYRFYSPSLQRWLNRDPIEEVGGINMYGFVGNDPIASIDIFGLTSKNPWSVVAQDVSEYKKGEYQTLWANDNGFVVTYNADPKDLIKDGGYNVVQVQIPIPSKTIFNTLKPIVIEIKVPRPQIQGTLVLSQYITSPFYSATVDGYNDKQPVYGKLPPPMLPKGPSEYSYVDSPSFGGGGPGLAFKYEITAIAWVSFPDGTYKLLSTYYFQWDNETRKTINCNHDDRSHYNDVKKRWGVPL